MSTMVLYAALMVAAPNDALTWSADYGKSLEASRVSQRPLLVVLEDSTDDGSQIVQIRQATRSQYSLLSQYGRCRLDVATPYGREVAAAFGADSFPFTAIIDGKSQKVVMKRWGAYSNDEWTATLAAHISAVSNSPGPSPVVRSTDLGGTASSPTPATSDSASPVVLKMLERNNELRAGQDLPPHRLNNQLTKAAQDHADYMARTDDFRHDANEGPLGRAKRHGYHGLIRENIAWGQRTVEEVFQTWRQSTPHWTSIISNTPEAGFGYAVSSEGRTYWVSVYGEPLEENASVEREQNQN